MINEADYLLQDETKKDPQWAGRLISHFRSVMKPLITAERAKKNMRVIMSDFDMAEVEKMFKDPKKLGFTLLPIVIMEKLRNILIGERVKAGVGVNINALDPSAELEREGDKKLLINRDSGEELFSHLQEKIGLPPWKLANEKTKGSNPFRGNVEQFDELGLDSGNDAQVSYFFKVWHKLQHEMDAQAIIDFCIEHNEVKENLSLWLDDIMAKKVIAMQTFVNDMTGVMEMQYLQPEKVRIIPGKRNDGKDAPALGFEDGMTVGEFLQRFGSAIDLERDMSSLIAAVNYCNGKGFQTISNNPNLPSGDLAAGDSGKVSTDGFDTKKAYAVDATECDWNDFVNFKINVGYIEFKSWNRETAKVGKDEHGNAVAYDKPATYQIKPGNTKYTQTAEVIQCTYKAWYLATSSLTQRLFKWGKLYHQLLEGTEDMYSSYSIHVKKERGPSVAEIARPWIEIAQESFAKIRWMIRKAKPAGTDYNFESLVYIGKHVIKSGNTKTDVMGVIKLFEEGVDRLYTIPKVNNQPVGGGSAVHHPVTNGLDKSVSDFRGLVEWAVLMIKDDIAMTQLREAYNAKPNDGLQLQMQAKEASENATNYMGEMIDSILRNAARQTLLTCQDAVKFKGSLLYKWLKDVIGEHGVQRVEELGNIAIHRYGLFVNSYSQYERRRQIQAETQLAWQQKEITYDIKILVDGIDDPGKAAYVLAFEKLRAEKLADQRAQQLHDNAMQLEKAKHDFELERIKEKGKLDNEGKDIAGHWQYLAAVKGADSRKEIKEAQINDEPNKIDHKADADIRKKAAEHHLAQQDALPSA